MISLGKNTDKRAQRERALTVQVFSFSYRFAIQFDPEPVVQKIERVWEFMWSVIKEHRETYDENNVRDLVDLYIQAERNNFEGVGVMDGEIQ